MDKKTKRSFYFDADTASILDYFYVQGISRQDKKSYSDIIAQALLEMYERENDNEVRMNDGEL